MFLLEVPVTVTVCFTLQESFEILPPEEGNAVAPPARNVTGTHDFR
ncbi:MAG: hypothetical protein NTW96_01380 [Planctomycetia bacterium]|nr:hypothetical protein [Planctomycetia bacterium]